MQMHEQRPEIRFGTFLRVFLLPRVSTILTYSLHLFTTALHTIHERDKVNLIETLFRKMFSLFELLKM